MGLKFVGIDPDTNGNHCPAVFVDEETGDFLLQGWTVTDHRTLADVARRSPVADNESTSGLNVAAGEDVRWLPRRRAGELCVPANDFWVFDNRLVRFGYFGGDGTFLEDELSDDPSVVRTCAEAFEAVWQRATPHAEYRPS